MSLFIQHCRQYYNILGEIVKTLQRVQGCVRVFVFLTAGNNSEQGGKFGLETPCSVP